MHEEGGTADCIVPLSMAAADKLLLDASCCGMAVELCTHDGHFLPPASRLNINPCGPISSMRLLAERAPAIGVVENR
jgi:hypothetical protein